MTRIRKKTKKKMMRKRRKSWRLVVPQEENIESFLWCMLPHSLSVLVIGIQYFCNRTQKYVKALDISILEIDMINSF